MDIAIDIRDSMHEKLVSINDVKNNIYESISVKEKKFICSQCGEYVAYVSKHKYKSYFRHATDGECDLRVNNDGDNLITNKLELNMYISKNRRNFDLLIGFGEIEKILFKKLVNIGAKIEIIGNGNLVGSYKVNNYNFSENEKNYKKISSIADEYLLEYHKSSVLQKKFGKKITGIRSNIGIFTISNNFGRLIRVNEEVSLNTEYYLVKKKNDKLLYKDLITFHEKGCLNLEADQMGAYVVGVVKFNIKNKDEFKKLAQYLRENLKVKLVNFKSELVTLWPPTIKDNIEEFYYKNEEAVFAKFESHMENFSLSVHSDNERKYNQGLKITNNNTLHKILLDDYKIGISFNENNYLLSKIYDKRSRDDVIDVRNLEMIDENGNCFKGGINEKVPYKNNLIIKSNFKCKVLHIKPNKHYTEISINKSHIILNNIELGDSIIWCESTLAECNLYFEKVSKYELKTCNYKNIYISLKKAKGTLIRNELLIRFLLKEISKGSQIYEVLNYYRRQNAFPYDAYKYLKELERLLLDETYI